MLSSNGMAGCLPVSVPNMIPSCIPSSFSPSPSLLLIRPQTLTPHLRLRFRFKPRRLPRTLSSRLLRSHPPLSSIPGDSAAAAPVLHFDDLVEKDWSFLDSDPTASSDQERADKARRIISAAGVRRDSRVLVSMGTAGFMDRLAESAPCELLLAIHDSLLALALIKERHDGVRCWQGGIDAVPERFAPFDAVFLCYLPGMAVTLDQLLSSLAARCSPGARLVISFDQGRDIIKQHREQYPDMVTFDLPGRAALEKAATDHSLQITEFVDEPAFYLAVLRYCES